MKRVSLLVGVGVLGALGIGAFILFTKEQNSPKQVEPTNPSPPVLSRSDPSASAEHPARKAVDAPKVATPTSPAVNENAADANSGGVIANDPFRTELESYQDTFLDDRPDVIHLMNYIKLLSEVARLDEQSIVRDKEGLVQGTFLIPNSKVRVDFKATDAGYQMYVREDGRQSTDRSATRNTVISISSENERVTSIGGVVQFFQRPDGPNEGKIVGCGFNIDNGTTSLRFLRAAPKAHIRIEPSDDSKSLPYAGLNTCDRWLAMMQEAATH